MRIGRRSFLMAILATPLIKLRAQVVPVPQWVPAGFPPFYEDAKYNNLIVHKQRGEGDDYTRWENNGGDTAQREGFVWFGIKLLQDLGIRPVVVPTLPWLDAIALLEDPQKPGEFRRHPDPRWNDTKTFSRDQQTPIVAALGALGPSTTLDRLWKAFDGRGRVCQNNEPGAPDHQNLFRRARRAGTEQIEAVGEFLLAGMVESIAARGSADPDDVGDDLNFIVNLAAASQWRSTPTIDAAICEYVKTRPINYGCYLERYRILHHDLVDKCPMICRVLEIMRVDPTPECHPIIGALRWYFRTETGGPWGPAALYEQVVENLFLNKTCADRLRSFNLNPKDSSESKAAKTDLEIPSELKLPG